jgi:tetratricopeptide (TPR) repeat protein
MGLFEHFIKVSDFWKKKKPAKKFQYPFTTTDSFRLFTEGLRAFQIWEGSTPHLRPDSRRDQETYLTEALDKWKECHERFPKDMLPTFYLAVACYADGRRHESITLFEKLAAQDPNGDVGKCAQYNIISLNHGDVEAARAKFGFPAPPSN